jgi:hypothetical protein
LLHQVGDLLELNVKFRCQNVKLVVHYVTNRLKNYILMHISFCRVEGLLRVGTTVCGELGLVGMKNITARTVFMEDC